MGHYGWLSAGQMMDGLALGETTPGPLIMVVAFVGFLGGYGQAFWGGELAWVAGTVAAVLVCWFTFLPSFVLILAGGPWVEKTRQQVLWSAPLTAISAAVVGVIVSLALFFSVHVMWPQGMQGELDLMALGLIVLSGLALTVGKRPVWQVILISALLGIAIQMGNMSA